MAGRKLNEIDFILNAQMNSGFHGTFTKAQAEFAKLGGEIAELHKAQSNVAAYQKQQGAIAATEDKLANLKKQHALLQTEIDETTGSRMRRTRWGGRSKSWARPPRRSRVRRSVQMIWGKRRSGCPPSLRS